MNGRVSTCSQIRVDEAIHRHEKPLRRSTLTQGGSPTRLHCPVERVEMTPVLVCPTPDVTVPVCFQLLIDQRDQRDTGLSAKLRMCEPQQPSATTMPPLPENSFSGTGKGLKCEFNSITEELALIFHASARRTARQILVT